MDNNKIIKLIKEREEEIDKLLCSSLGEFISSSEYLKKINDFMSQVTEDASEEKLNEILSELNVLKEKLQRYEKFIIADRELNLNLENNDKNNIDKEVVMLCVKQIIRILNEIEKENIYKDDEAKDLVTFFYKIAYDLMKNELLVSSDSLIYKYISEKEEIRKLVKGFLLNDYNKLKELTLNNNFDEQTQKKLLKELFDIEFNEEERLINEVLSVETNKPKNLFDVDIIRLIAIFDIKNKDYIEDINSKITAVVSNLEKKVGNHLMYLLKRDEHIESLENIKVKRKNSKPELNKRIASIMITLSILGTSYLGLSSLLKKLCVDKVYEGTITTCSSVDEESKTRKEFFDINTEIEENIKINVYSKVYTDGFFSSKVRVMETYDVTDIGLDNIKEYINLDLRKLDYDIEEINYKKDTPTSEYVEVVKTIVNKNKIFENLNETDYYIGLGIYLLLIDFMLNIFNIRNKNNYNKIYLGILINIYKTFTKGNREESLYKILINTEWKDIKAIKDIDKELESIILEYEKNKEVFFGLYNQYQYAILGSNELLNRIEVDDKIIKRKTLKKIDN